MISKIQKLSPSINVTFLIIKIYNLIFTTTSLIKLTFLIKIEIRLKSTFKCVSNRDFKIILSHRYNNKSNIF